MKRALTGSTVSSSRHSSSSFNSQDEAEVAEVEMLLEAYDMHLEHALGRLQVGACSSLVHHSQHGILLAAAAPTPIN